MSIVRHATRSLFPRETRAGHRRSGTGAVLPGLLTIGFALTPLAAVIEAMRLTA